MHYLYAAIIGYLIGSFQPSYIIGKTVFKKDIRELGNGNVGASNALVVFGRRVGVITGFIDILKSALAIIIIKQLFGQSVSAEELINLTYITGFFAIVGHINPFYLQFKGGKGTASLFGFILALEYRLFLLAIVLFVIATLLTDYIVIGTLSLVTLFLIYTLIYNLSAVPVFISSFIFIISVYKHIPNYKRIRKGTEKKVRKSVLKK